MLKDKENLLWGLVWMALHFTCIQNDLVSFGYISSVNFLVLLLNSSTRFIAYLFLRLLLFVWGCDSIGSTTAFWCLRWTLNSLWKLLCLASCFWIFPGQGNLEGSSFVVQAAKVGLPMRHLYIKVVFTGSSLVRGWLGQELGITLASVNVKLEINYRTWSVFFLVFPLFLRMVVLGFGGGEEGRRFLMLSYFFIAG